MDYKTKVTYEFEPDDLPELPGEITAFKFIRKESHYSRREGASVWHEDVTQYKREVLADGITRRGVVNIIADGADWLCYVEGKQDD